ncbi:MAG: metallophosphoesterase [Pseudomonadota bacterium]
MSSIFDSAPKISVEPTRRRLALNAPVDLAYVIGDVHGCHDLLLELEEAIRADAAVHANGATPLVVFVGDLIDRGDKSSSVLDHLIDTEDGLHRISILGNHEAMFLDFLRQPKASSRWLGYGGRETLQSYGIHGDGVSGFDMPARRLGQMLNANIPDSHLNFLLACPISLRLPGYLITHAGLAAYKTLGEQDNDDLIWSRPEFLDDEDDSAARLGLAEAGLVLIHGHVPQEDVLYLPHRINVDTGAYASGKLSALRIMPNQEPAAISVERKTS